MSDLFVSVSLIIFLGIMNHFWFLYLAKSAMAAGAQIVTGVIDGNPLPMGARKGWLYAIYVPYSAGGVAAGVFFGFAWMQLARHVEDPDAKLLAYIGAFLCAWSAISWLVNGTSTALFYRSLLRQAEAD